MGTSNTPSCCVDHRSGSGDNADMTMLPLSLSTIHALEGVTAIGAEVEVLRDIRKEFRDGEKEDSLVKAVEELWKGCSRLVQMAEWSESKGLLHFRGKIYVPDGRDLC